MPPPLYSPEDYLAQFQKLLPRGRVWHRGWGWLQDADLLTLMPTWARLQERLNDLIAEIFPCTTDGLLPEWEETLGLPDQCIGPLDTIQERVAAVCAKFTARGAQNAAYFVHLANALGVDAEVINYAPFRASIDTCGEPLNDEAWAFAWSIIVPAALVAYFRSSISTVGEPLASWGNATLVCLIEEYKPAHTIPIIKYALTESAWDDGASIWDSGGSIWDEGVLMQ